MSGSLFSEGGHYLALDTSGPSGFVAVGRGGRVLARARLERKAQHASRLVPAIYRVLEQGSVSLAEVAGIIVGEGPGSFTGVRVAAATAKGMARALDVPLWAVSSLAAGALGDLGQGGAGVRYVLFDARGERVYGGCYGVGSRGVETLLPPHAGDLRPLLAGEVPAGAVFAGDGAERHRRVIESCGFRVEPPPVGDPSGDALLYLLALHPDMPPVAELSTWEPRYVKASSAEREWVA
ncbi:MAG: tRNA (adenosine(37)-N6)-threonylcarbamoyltransferase complex dimerization subunit type 1 TsaB [Longimicrobiales bacterium]|nr:tRNA (adenosine(37)-N6)-threonylcarbamoyltransferase complex dimerization subunit type 1 TsaB [Longimicrobiales bacterium]